MNKNKAYKNIRMERDQYKLLRAGLGYNFLQIFASYTKLLFRKHIQNLQLAKMLCEFHTDDHSLNDISLILVAELISKGLRPSLGCMYSLSYPVGYITLPVIAYFLPQWRFLQLAISLPMLVFLLHFWLVAVTLTIIF